MNEQSPITELQRNHAETRAALRSLARRQLYMSRTYRAWAQETEQAGKLDDFRKWSAEAAKYRENARWHLNRASEVYDA